MNDLSRIQAILNQIIERQFKQTTDKIIKEYNKNLDDLAAKQILNLIGIKTTTTKGAKND